MIPSVATNDPLSRTNGLSRVIQFDAESFYGTPGLENKTKVKFGISVVTRDGKDYLVARGIRAA